MSVDRNFLKDFSACLQSGSRPNKEQFAAFCLVFKQSLGLLLGVLFGWASLTGLFGFGLFLFAQYGLTLAFCSARLDLDEDEISRQDIASEGLLPGLALFLLSWTLSYTQFHFASN